MRLPLVSVVIPTYNCADFLPEAIDSVLAQSYPNVEIIVVDDGSTDRTARVMERYVDRLVYLRKANGGLASARNFGLRSARGDLVALMDADDICLPGRLTAQAACLTNQPDVVLVSTDFSSFTGAHRLLEASHIANYYRLVRSTPGGLRGLYASCSTLDDDEILGAIERSSPIEVLYGSIYEQLIWGNFIHPPTVMVRRAAMESIGGFDEGIPNGTDYDCFIRLSRLGPVAYLDVPLLKYRYSETQLSSHRNAAQVSLDTITALDKIRAADPAMVQQHQARFDRRIGKCYLNAADAWVDSDRLASADNLFKSMSHGVLTRSTLNVIAKILLPRWVLERLRSIRNRQQADTSGRLI